MHIEPKRIRRQYRRTPFTVTFVPATGEWRWEIRRQIERVYDGTATDMQKAIREAQRTIDRIVDA